MTMNRQGLDGSKIIPIIEEGGNNCSPVLLRRIAYGKRNFRQDETLNSHNHNSAILQTGLPAEDSACAGLPAEALALAGLPAEASA
jgi:hypothetical protein